jgi:hypothetical protein
MAQLLLAGEAVGVHLGRYKNGLWKATGVYGKESDRESSDEGIAMADNNRFVALSVRHCDYDIHLHAFPRPARGSKNGIFLNALATLEAQCSASDPEG